MAAAHLQLVTVVIARHHVERDIVLQILSVCLSVCLSNAGIMCKAMQINYHIS